MGRSLASKLSEEANWFAYRKLREQYPRQFESIRDERRAVLDAIHGYEDARPAAVERIHLDRIRTAARDENGRFLKEQP